jgi:hypothetical protein
MLDRVGIRQESAFIYSDLEDVLTDNDNQVLPDYRWHSTLKVHDDYVGSGSYQGGCCVVGSQHCQVQMFPTIKKIIDFLDKEGIYHEDLTGDDGGSLRDYEEWESQGCKPNSKTPELMQIRIYTSRLSKSEIRKVKELALKTFGIKMIEKERELIGKFNPKNNDCVMAPERFCRPGNEVRFVGRIRAALDCVIEEMKGTT